MEQGFEDDDENPIWSSIPTLPRPAAKQIAHPFCQKNSNLIAIGIRPHSPILNSPLTQKSNPYRPTRTHQNPNLHNQDRSFTTTVKYISFDSAQKNIFENPRFLQTKAAFFLKQMKGERKR